MVTFRAKLGAGLAERGIQVTEDLDSEAYDAVLVIGGTRQLVALRQARKRGIRVVQRLDGMNWLQRKTHTGLRHWLRAESGNWLLGYVRARLASRIVYQSHFVQDWWESSFGQPEAAARVIYNGVDLKMFNPRGKEKPPEGHVRILMVEGNLQGGYELGLESGVALAEAVAKSQGKQVQLAIAGQVDQRLKEKWNQNSKVDIDWIGVVPNQQIPALNRGAHMLYSADINAACPNSVIEALACGLPVVAFDTGALKELATPEAGRVVPYGGDPWKLESPDIRALARAAGEILNTQKTLRAGARRLAETVFGLDAMVDAYIQVLGG